MIDFRYHLVSLVSVFLALAIGVVLGAGPLRESIGDTLTEQVDALRTDKSNLQEAVANRDLALDQRDAFIAAVGPELLEGTLTGAQVVVVALPDVETDAVTAATDQLATAGASVVATATIGSAWTDESGADARDQLGAELAPVLDPTVGASEDPQQQLAAALSYALVAPGATVTGGQDPASEDPASEDPASEDPASEGPAAAGDVLDQLTAADLVTVSGVAGADPAQGRAVVVLAPAPSSTEDDAAVTAATTTAEDSWDPLIAALDQRASGTVLTGPTAAGEAPGLLAQVRSVDSDALEAVSVVDGTEDVAGLATAALALREQLGGGRGDYGTSSTADAVAPASPAAGAP